MIKVILGNSVKLSIQLSGQEINQYIRAEVWNQDLSSIKNTVNLAHIANGLYSIDYAGMTEKGRWQVIYTIYTDSGYTIINNSYGSISEDFYVSEVETTINKLDAMIEDVGGNRYNTKALEQAPTGSGGGSTSNDITMRGR